MFVLDTDILPLFQHGHPVVVRRCLAVNPVELAITVISVEEQLSGWYALLRRAKRHADLAWAYLQLGDTVRFLGSFQIITCTAQALAHYDLLLSMKLNVRKMDLRIASVVLERGAVLVTRNVRDFQRIPSLQIEDWTQ
jgi:tRNA(fMet)-specific endonuclease VapC